MRHHLEGQKKEREEEVKTLLDKQLMAVAEATERLQASHQQEMKDLMERHQQEVGVIYDCIHVLVYLNSLGLTVSSSLIGFTCFHHICLLVVSFDADSDECLSKSFKLKMHRGLCSVRSILVFCLCAILINP